MKATQSGKSAPAPAQEAAPAAPAPAAAQPQGNAAFAEDAGLAPAPESDLLGLDDPAGGEPPADIGALAPLVGMPTTNDGEGGGRAGAGGGGGRGEPAGGSGRARPTGLGVFTLTRRNLGEWKAEMEVLPSSDADPSPWSGLELVEHFGPPTPLGGRLGNADLRIGPGVPHTAADVMARTTCGDPGHFFADDVGMFDDFHGGPGFSDGWVNWFTSAALARGVGWYFEQTYTTVDGQAVGRFRVERELSTSDGLVVRKTRLG